MAFQKVDEYALKARAIPALLALLPLALVVLPTLGPQSLLFGLFAPVGGTLVVSFLLAQWGRDQGKLKEPELFAIWGGKPTTVLLRHRGEAGSRVTLERRHRRLERLSSGVVLPTLGAEAEDPMAADESYEAATKILIQRTRDKQRFSLLFEELVSYGFRRNLWGLKPFAVSVLLISICAHLCLGFLFGLSKLNNEFFAAFDIALLAIWCVIVSPGWVYIPARAYAERLLDALDQMTELDAATA